MGIQYLCLPSMSHFLVPTFFFFSSFVFFRTQNFYKELKHYFSCVCKAILWLSYRANFLLFMSGEAGYVVCSGVPAQDSQPLVGFPVPLWTPTVASGLPLIHSCPLWSVLHTIGKATF